MDNVTFIRTLRDTAETYNKAADLLEGIDPRAKKQPSSVNGASRTRRVMSAAARKRIADAQRARWAKWKAKQKRAA